MHSNSVECVFQDSDGMIWLGTHDGLSVYDSYRIMTYRQDSHDPESIGNNCIYCILENDDGRIWVGTERGLYILDRMTGKFSTLPFLEEGLELSGDNQPMRSQFYSFLGDCYYALDRAETAFLMYEEVLKINPNDALVLNNYAYYLALRKENLSKAEQMSAQAVKLDPNNATALDTYAWVLYVRGNYSQARFYMKLCLEKVTEPSGVYFDHYGDILYKYGSKSEAWDMWKKALELGLDDEEALEILKQKVETGILPE